MKENKILLQLALDDIEADEAKNLILLLGDVVDIVEIGTPFIMRDGIGVVQEFRNAFPESRILADLKIIDGASLESSLAFEAGADIVTVLGVADDVTIKTCVEKAKEHGKSVMADMLCVKNVEKRALELEALGTEILCVHTAFDKKSTTAPPLGELMAIKKAVRKAKIAIAGGIDNRTAAGIAAEGPDIMIVGSWITGNTHKKEAAESLRSLMDTF
jgi:3-hexulose-6-phosphate synthase